VGLELAILLPHPPDAGTTGVHSLCPGRLYLMMI
jgi:hypothetical protein